MVALHEFMAQHRDEIIRRVARDRHLDGPESELLKPLGALVDEMIAALQRKAGLPASSPLPGKSPTAVWLGSQHQARGYAISQIAENVGSISNMVGELGKERGLRFSSDEYQVFNQCIDTASATAVEQYWKQAEEQREHHELERVGAVVHELRNTLAGSRMALAVLRRGEVGILSKTGDVLERGLQRLETLIGQMIFAVQLGAGVTLQVRRLSVAALARDVMDSAVPERNIVLKADIEQGLEVNADEGLMISAISNLVQNAFKFTRPGGHIVIRAYGEPSWVVVEIQDECGGLPPGKPEQLFSPFVSKSTSRGGLGLGLAISRDAVEAHGGQISVTDLPGQGCVFRLKLPSDL